MLQHLEQYLTRPDVIAKLSSKFPNATGVPNNIKVANLEDAVGQLAARSYIKRKNDALITSGLNSLKEISDE